MAEMEASFSTLVMSIGSSALMNLGHAPNPVSGKTEKDLKMARFNIDLLMVLQEKTKGHLTHEEKNFIEALIKDLQIKYIEVKK